MAASTDAVAVWPLRRGNRCQAHRGRRMLTPYPEAVPRGAGAARGGPGPTRGPPRADGAPQPGSAGPQAAVAAPPTARPRDRIMTTTPQLARESRMAYH